MRVFAALSSGVDSAVAAARAVDTGHEVVGVHMVLSSQSQECRIGSCSYCSLEDATDAAHATEVMGIPLYVWDLAEDFEERVIVGLIEWYALGHTPNPCVCCSEFVKFCELAQRARALGFGAVCTGHYVSVREGELGRKLHRGADPLKDQFHVLAVMGREELSRAILPLGEMATKAEVRVEVEARGLGVSNGPDSYDICFIPDGDIQGFLRACLGFTSGDIVTFEGELVGRHDGYWNFTVGQHKDLRFKSPVVDGCPCYVTETHPDTNQVTVGAAESLSAERIEANDVVWPAEDDMAEECRNFFVQVRAHEVPAAVSGLIHEDREAAWVMGVEDGILVSLAEPIRRVVVGRSLAVYRDSRILGEGTILRASRGWIGASRGWVRVTGVCAWPRGGGVRLGNEKAWETAALQAKDQWKEGLGWTE